MICKAEGLEKTRSRSRIRPGLFFTVQFCGWWLVVVFVVMFFHACVNTLICNA